MRKQLFGGDDHRDNSRGWGNQLPEYTPVVHCCAPMSNEIRRKCGSGNDTAKPGVALEDGDRYGAEAGEANCLRGSSRQVDDATRDIWTTVVDAYEHRPGGSANADPAPER